MRIVIISQDDPFYLGENLDYLLQKMPSHSTVVAAVIADPSPFGKKESFKQKTLKTLKIFGYQFFLYYSMKYVTAKLRTSNSVKKVLARHRVPVINIEGNINSKKNLGIIGSYNPDLLISILGNQIFKEPLFTLAPKGCLNLHTALLPKYRGLMPSFWVLKNKEQETGVSVFFVDKGIDSGPIIVQKRVPVNGMTQAALIKFTKKIGMDAIIESIEKIQSGDFTLIPNPDTEMTYYSFPTKDDVKEFYKGGNKFF